jgi:hypothetical protein
MADKEKDDSTKISEMISLWSALNDRFDRFRREQIKDFDYITGDQISRKMRDDLTKAMRPALVYNLLQPIVVYVGGTLRANRSVMRAYPMREGDENRADMHTTLVSDWAMGQCNGYEELAKASTDAIIGKVGWTNNFWTTRERPDGEWITESFDPFMIMWDPDARKTDQTDWRYYMLSGYYTIDQILACFDLDRETAEEVRQTGEMLEADLKGESARSFLSRAVGAIDQWWSMKRGRLESGKRHLSDMADVRSGLYRVIEFHERRYKDHRWFYSSMTRGKIPFPDDFDDRAPKERDSWIKMAKVIAPGGREVVLKRAELWVTSGVPALMPDKLLVQQPYPVQGRGFQHKPIFCYPFHPDLTRTNSIIDALIDPSDSFNQRRMTGLEALMDAVSPNYLALTNSIGPAELLNWQTKQRHTVKFYKNPIAKPTREEPPAGLFAQLDAFAREDEQIIDKVSGVNPNLMGRQQSSGESGILYARRVAEGLKMLSMILSQSTITQQLIFNYCDRSLQEYMTLPRKIRLLSKSGDPNWLSLNWHDVQGVHNDITEGEYDFRPDIAQATATMKQLKFIEALEFIKVIPSQLVYYPELFSLWDSPAAGRMKQYCEEKMGLLKDEAEQRKDVFVVQALTAILDQMGITPKHLGAGGARGGNGEAVPTQQPEMGQPVEAVQ